MRPRRVLITASSVTVAALLAVTAVVLHGAVRRADPVETPSALLADRGPRGSDVRLVGILSSGPVAARPTGIRFTLRDEHGTGRVLVEYADVAPSQLRAGRLVEATGTFRGGAFEARPGTLLVICGHGDPDQHC